MTAAVLHAKKPRKARPYKADMPSLRDQRKEWIKCRDHVDYFIEAHVKLKNEKTKRWEPFLLWAAQVRALAVLCVAMAVVVLKARQIGLTWLALAYILHQLIFVGGLYLLFSVGQREAKDLLKRIKGMYEHLPPYLQARDADWLTSEGRLSSGGEVLSLPSSAGDSFTASGVFIDEADLIRDLKDLMERSEPTINDGGWIILNSRSDKSRPESPFKRIYVEARRRQDAGELTTLPGDYHPIFLDWRARPERDDAWYARQKAKALRDTGSLDSVHANYPATDTEALTGRTLNKRIPLPWLDACYEPEDPIPDEDLPADAPAIPGLRVYRLPEPGRAYVSGGDPAQGLRDGDDSACVILTEDTGEEVASFAGKWEPRRDFPTQTAELCAWYNDAPCMPLENNHGHAYIRGLEDEGVIVLDGHLKRPGWTESPRGKRLMYGEVAGDIKLTYQRRQQDPDAPGVIIRSKVIYDQLASIDRETLRAPEGRHDDLADAFSAAMMARLDPDAISRKKRREARKPENTRKAMARVASRHKRRSSRMPRRF